MKPSGKRVSVRMIEAKKGRKKLAILLVKPSMRVAFPDKIIEKLFKRYKAGVFCAFRLLSQKKRKKP